MRLLGIDYGSKRIGLAISDPTRTIARELDVLPNDRFFFDALKKYLDEYEISEVVIGEPFSVSTGQHTKQTQEVHKFSQELTTHEPRLTIYFIDERFTSKLIHERFKGVKKKPEVIDGMAAALILQMFLDAKEPPR